MDTAPLKDFINQGMKQFRVFQNAQEVLEALDHLEYARQTGEASKAKLQNEIDTLTDARDSLLADVAAANIQFAGTLDQIAADHAANVAAKKAELDALDVEINTKLDEANARMQKHSDDLMKLKADRDAVNKDLKDKSAQLDAVLEQAKALVK